MAGFRISSDPLALDVPFGVALRQERRRLADAPVPAFSPLPRHPGGLDALSDSVVEVDGAAIAHNVEVLRRRLSAGTEMCPVVKCDAYGLGATMVVRRLATLGIERVAVFRATEAIELCAAGAAMPAGRPDGLPPGTATAAWPRVLVLQPLDGGVVARLRDDDADVRPLRDGLRSGRVALSIHDETDVDRAAAIALSVRRPVALHLFVDTGMHRGGAAPERAVALVTRLRAAPGLVLEGLSTHLRSPERADESADAQVCRFDRVEESITERTGVPPLRHVASTFGTLRKRSFHREIVRIGLGWTGHGPASMEVPSAPIDLRPCARWLSRVTEVARIGPGERVGYGGTWTARRATTIALVPVGYGDGLPPALGASDERRRAGVVGLPRRDGRVDVAPIVGRVNMDQIVVDVTDADAVARGALVEVIGDEPGAPHGLHAHARVAGVPPHAILCGISPRIPRRHRRCDAAPAIVEPAGGGMPLTGTTLDEIAGGPAGTTSPAVFPIANDPEVGR